MALNTLDYVRARVDVEPQRARGGFLAMGVVSILFAVPWGILTLEAAELFVVELVIRRESAASVFASARGLVLAAAAGTFFVWLGIDLIRARRRSRPVMIAVAWMAIVASITSVLVDVVLLVERMADRTYGVDITFEHLLPVLAVLLFGVLYPASTILFLNTGLARRLMAESSPTRAWSERCATPVFVACAAMVALAFFALWMVSTAQVPVFGSYIESPAAVGMLLAFGALCALAAMMMFRGRRAGVWMAAVLIAVGFGSTAVTICEFGPLAFYRWIGLPDGTFGELAQSRLMSSRAPGVPVGVIGAACLVYLFRIRGAVAPEWEDRHDL